MDKSGRIPRLFPKNEMMMKGPFAFGFVALLGSGIAVMAIEAPESVVPIPPQASPGRVVEPSSEHAESRKNRAPAVERAYLGVGGSPVPELLSEHLGLKPGEGLLVRSLDPVGPAAKAGLANHDVITKVAGLAVSTHEQLRDAVAARKPGDELDIDFIHRGEAKALRVALVVAPAAPPAVAGGAGLAPLDALQLDGMPEDQAGRVKEAIEQNLRAFGGIDGRPGLDAFLGGVMGERMERMFDGLAEPDAGGGGAFQFKSSSTIRVLDDEGSVELESQDGGKTVRVFGKDGTVQWEGPYDTLQDKDAAPPEVRERIDRLNIDMDFKGNGLRLRMLPGMNPDGK